MPYTTGSDWGNKIEIDYNNSHSLGKAHDVLVTTKGYDDNVLYTSVRGEKAIRHFLYQFALYGGLIKEGETLSIAEPSDREIPNDGTYKLTGASQDRPIAIVQGGRVMIPQPESGEIMDFTDVYLSKYSQWELTPLVKASRHHA